jgi:hypothetical protein
MFDVQSVSCSSQAEFHTSTAVGLISGQSNYQQTVPFWCGFIREVVGSHRKSESRQEIRNLSKVELQDVYIYAGPTRVAIRGFIKYLLSYKQGRPKKQP